jgi:heme-degrading monooxygenase HmoA
MERLVVSITTLRGPVPEMDETGGVAGEALLPWLRDLDGFRGVMIATDEAREQAKVLTFWESRGAADRSRASRESMRDRMAATVGMTVESTEAFVVSALELVDPS